MVKVSYRKHDFAELRGCLDLVNVTSVVFKGSEAVAKLAGKASFFLERCLIRALAVGFSMQSLWRAFGTCGTFGRD